MNNDNVNRPAYYTDGKIEVIDFIEDKKLNFHRGNAVKYIARAGKKDASKEIEDLQKAAWYLHREIQRLGGNIEPYYTAADLEILIAKFAHRMCNYSTHDATIAAKQFIEEVTK